MTDASPDTPDTVLFDIDGTLLDSNYHHALAWSRAFQRHGLSVAVWDIHRHIGMGGDRLVAAVAGDDAEEQHGDDLRDAWEQEFDAIAEEAQPAGRCPRAAGRARPARASRWCWPRRASPSTPQRALDLLHADEHTDAATTSEDAEASKPDPELLDEALGRVGAAARLHGRRRRLGRQAAATRRACPRWACSAAATGGPSCWTPGRSPSTATPRTCSEHLDEALGRVSARD